MVPKKSGCASALARECGIWPSRWPCDVHAATPETTLEVELGDDRETLCRLTVLADMGARLKKLGETRKANTRAEIPASFIKNIEYKTVGRPGATTYVGSDT